MSLSPSSLSPFNPFAQLRSMEEAFAQLFNEPQTNRPWTPGVDIYETENELVLKADLPDVDKNSIDVSVENRTLTLAAERRFEKQESAKGFHRLERPYGKFVRSFSVPNTFDTENIAAEYKDGVLTVTLPKKEAAKPRQIKVEVKG
jgi:HSP20 family protein